MGSKWLVGLVALAIGAMIVVVIVSSLTTGSNNQAANERQITERVLAQEQTKQNGQELRAEETARTTNSLTLILGSIMAFGAVALLFVFISDRLQRNRIMEMQELNRLERLHVRELKQLELTQPRQPWLLTGNANYGEDKERQIVIYEDR